MAEHPPLTPADALVLKWHHDAIVNIQKRYGLGAKGEVQAWYPYGDDKLVVESNGLGGGTLMLVSDHYPFDGYDLRYSRDFQDEKEASAAAEWFDDLLENTSSDMSAGEFFRLLDEGKKPWEDTADETEETGDKLSE